MEATTALTGQGGWPMTCLLTPDGEPFFAGTFFPRAQFSSCCTSVATAWRDHRDEVLAAGQRVVTAIADAGRPERVGCGRSAPSSWTHAVSAAAARSSTTRAAGSAARRSSRRRWCSSSCCATPSAPGSGRRSRWWSGHSTAMARGGMYDQLAGGFARYSVDGAWVVPHFEKMLYDNALLLRVLHALVAADR